MPLRQINEESHLKLYQDLTENKLKIRFPMTFLRGSRVFAQFDQDERIRGGFVISYEGSYRVLQSLPRKVIRRDPILGSDAVKSVMEVTGLWVDPFISGKLRLNFWISLVRELLRAGRSHILYAYSSHDKNLARLYAYGRPRRIFKGVTKPLPGNESPGDEVVEMVAIRNVAIAAVTNPKFFLRRFRNFRRTAGKLR